METHLISPFKLPPSDKIFSLRVSPKYLFNVLCINFLELSFCDCIVATSSLLVEGSKHLENLASLLSEHAGECDVYVHLGSKRIWLGADVRVDPDSGLLGELRVLFGAECILT